jgi:hypothetical protein
MLKKLGLAGVATLALLATQTLSVGACGGLVAPNGAIRLSRATTLVEWHDGVEHYMTSFSYQGEATNFGWIVPLPAVPDKVEEGGNWTLQRLFRETHPQRQRFSARFAHGAKPVSSDSAEVLQQVKVQALDITVLRGSGKAVIDWATEHDFFLNAETRGHLLVYAHASPIFMAAKFDVAEARARQQRTGDGAPVLITMKTRHPWVPLEVLSLGTTQVKADLYLLMDQPVNTTQIGAILGESAVGTTVPGAPGFTLQFQRKMTPALYQDLSTDKNMGWVRADSWLTYLSLDAPGQTVTYDMGITPMGVIKLARYGTKPMAIVEGESPARRAPQYPTLPLGTAAVVATLLALIGMAAALTWLARREPR